MTAASIKKGLEIIKAKASALSLEPGVYRMLSDKKEVLYVGKAKHLKKRVLSYTQPGGLPVRLQRMISLTRDMEFIVTQSEEAALLLEAQLIKKFKPRFNVLLKDDKSFPYIHVTSHAEAPQLVKYRGKPRGDGVFFGPFASSRAMAETTDTLTRLFQLRTCSESVYKNRSRPCLQYHIKRCSAPCVGYVSPEEYQESVGQAQDFLRGKTRALQVSLEEKMLAESAKENFEKAAALRDRIRSLNQVQRHAQELGAETLEVDVFAVVQKEGVACVQVFFYRHGTSYGNRAYFPKHIKGQASSELLGAFVAQFYQTHPIPQMVYLSEDVCDGRLLERALKELSGISVSLKTPKKSSGKKLVDHAVMNARQALERQILEQISSQKLVQQVADFFGLSERIQRIEVYDNSHLQGTNPYGTLIVAGPNGFDKKAYRQFKIKGESGAQGDDYGMMKEVFTRRFQKTNQEEMPQLIFIDEGKGQLGEAMEVLRSYNLQTVCVGVAKGEERNAGKETLYFADGSQKSVEPGIPVTFYVQRLRDEAHRFAIGTHRAGRSKKMIQSVFDEIPGIGPKRKKALITYFGGVERLKRAGIDDFQKVPGISLKVAQDLYRFFQG